MWWFRPENPTFRKLKQEDQEFKTSLRHIVRMCLKTNPKGSGAYVLCALFFLF